MSKLDEFLAGERIDDVALFLTHEYLDEEGKIANYGQEVDNGIVLVVPGDDGRGMFAAGTGMDAMDFAQGAMGQRGSIDADLGGGECPEAASDENHNVKFVFTFAEEQNEEVGGLYEEGDVIHAYAQCECGTAYSDRWVVGEK
ncbi:DUF5807 family protein [Halogranum rubrum]|uniref:Uncharacterized protein n=1 Tax=Halogranum salarium B-1 TaxID=1210908 RepID=J2ZZE0_9EURY|nr:DUF5807 family protein [Halogranum salarium]EJN58408.1 hypothetical protein HSB1_38250 [Halogranum salarium B-1]